MNELLAEQDLSKLPYKKLQSLALKNKIPGNIKKYTLVRILEARRTGNDREVAILLMDHNKNRKKKNKNQNHFVGSMEQSSLQDQLIRDNEYNVGSSSHYLYQQQQIRWRMRGQRERNYQNDYRQNYLTYSDVQQFMCNQNQACENFDTNNNNDFHQNSQLELEVRNNDTQKYCSNFQGNYHYSKTDNVNYSDRIAESNKSLLLKKMLQAPVGTNLGDIISPADTGTYQNWETYPVDEASIDNSDTLTAKSDVIEVDEEWGCVSNIHQDSYQTENQFYQQYQHQSSPSQHINNVELINSNADLSYRNHYLHTSSNEYRNNYFQSSATASDWSTFHSEDISGTPHAVQTEEIICHNYQQQQLQHMTSDYEYLDNYHRLNNNHSIPAERLQGYSQETYDPNHHHQESYYTQVNPTIDETSVIPDYSYSQDKEKNQSDYQLQFINYDNTKEQTTFLQNISEGSNVYNTEFCQRQNSVDESIEEVNSSVENCQNESNNTSSSAAEIPRVSNGEINQFYWPNWSNNKITKESGHNLENLLNLSTECDVNYMKFGETCCVYSSKTPVMSLRIGVNSIQMQENCITTDQQRYHTFASKWVLFDEQNKTLWSYGNSVKDLSILPTE